MRGIPSAFEGIFYLRGNKMTKKFFTSESVTEGHPDKVCDQIADAILDEILAKDPDARVAIEVSASTGYVIVSGQVSTACYADIQKIVRDVVEDIGYTRGKFGFDAENCAVLISLEEQSKDIAEGVDHSLENRGGRCDKYDITGAGDQGMMFGYACDETPEYMPLAISLAHKLSKELTELRKSGTLPYLRPDGKTQVTVEYEDDVPVRIEAVVVSAQHSSDIDIEVLRKDIEEKLIRKVIKADMLDENTKIYINPTGRFVIGGPKGDTGLTGRKIIVDTYGGYAHHGGGAFSGKDPTKVDRSACYAARHVAKNIVASGLAKKCEVALSYAIGVAEPVSIEVDTFKTAIIPEERIRDIIKKVFDLRPAFIIDYYDLKKPMYRKLTNYGHFGREDLDVNFERLEKVDEIKSLL